MIETVGELMLVQSATIAGKSEVPGSRRFTIPAKREINQAGHQRPFTLIEGWAAQQWIARNGERQLLGLILPGEVHTGRSALSICALSHCIIEVPPKCQWPSLAEGTKPSGGQADDPQALLRLLTITGRGTALNKVAFVFSEIDTRLSDDLTDNEQILPCPLTQADIADICCLSPIHVNRMIRVLRQSGLVETSRSQILIKDLSRLKRLVDCVNP